MALRVDRASLETLTDAFIDVLEHHVRDSVGLRIHHIGDRDQVMNHLLASIGLIIEDGNGCGIHARPSDVFEMNMPKSAGG